METQKKQPINGKTPAPNVPHGGQVSISPPSKVKTLSQDSIQSLASGIDSLVVALDVKWMTSDFFRFLKNRKDEAIAAEAPAVGFLRIVNFDDGWPFTIRPFGVKGYEWLVNSNEFDLKIGNWMNPISRPSVIAEIRSETLWHLGPEQAFGKVLSLLKTMGGKVISTKLSRVDLCVDFLCCEQFWQLGLLDNIVTRAQDIRNYLKYGKFTGVGIGSGKLSARLYDKGLEIETKSKKFWMFDIWGLENIPEEQKVIRVEFQLRREAIKELGLDKVDDAFRYGGNTWAYCTTEWLKFQDRPGKHHTQRKYLPWWQSVQNAYSGAQGAEPLVRNKALTSNKQQIIRQAYGLLSSLTAIQKEVLNEASDSSSDMNDCLNAIFESTGLLSGDSKDFSQRVISKRAKYNRMRQKTEEAQVKRRALFFPDNVKGGDCNA